MYVCGRGRNMALVVYLAPPEYHHLVWVVPKHLGSTHIWGTKVGLLGSFGWASETSDGQAGADIEFWVIWGSLPPVSSDIVQGGPLLEHDSSAALRTLGLGPHPHPPWRAFKNPPSQGYHAWAMVTWPGPDQWGGGAARRGFQGDAATTDSDPPSAVEKPGESSQVKSQRQPLTEALKKSKWVTKTGSRVINVFLKKIGQVMFSGYEPAIGYVGSLGLFLGLSAVVFWSFLIK